MNTFSTNTTGTQQVARYLIDERVQAAEQRRMARLVRAERRAAARAARAVPVEHHVPWAAFRFLHPVH
jgi:hypothetical protein